MIVFGTEEKEVATEPYRAMCRALAEAFGARAAEIAAGARRDARSGAPSTSGSRPGVDGDTEDDSDVPEDAGSQAFPTDAIARARSCSEGSPIVLRPAEGVVHVVAYQHRFGVDFTVHATLEGAYGATMETVRRQCLRDEAIRERVESHFGHWMIERMSFDEQDELVTRWERFADGEAIWISTCDIESGLRAAPCEGDTACVVGNAGGSGVVAPPPSGVGCRERERSPTKQVAGRMEDPVGQKKQCTSRWSARSGTRVHHDKANGEDVARPDTEPTRSHGEGGRRGSSVGASRDSGGERPLQRDRASRRNG